MKYRQAGLIKSSVGRRWMGMTAELHTHAAGLIVENRTSRETELAIALDGPSEAFIHCISGKAESRIAALPGTIWTCPPGIREDYVETSAMTPTFLHIFLPNQAFEGFLEDHRGGIDAMALLRYECGFQDPLIAACGIAIAQELYQETSAGSLLIEGIATTMAARLIQSNSGIGSDDPLPAVRTGLDPRRLQRVLEAIDAELDEQLSLSYLASIACLSQFHFARAFKNSTGMSPRQYVSSRRLRRAKELIVAAALPLSKIATSSGFSSQANFNRAFKNATGMTPRGYKIAMTK